MKDTEWLPFLLTPENLPCALEVGAHYNKLKYAVLDYLFGQIQAGLESHFRAKRASDSWSANRDPASQAWAAVYTWPNDYPDECPGVYVRLERALYQGQSRFVLGVATNTGLVQLDSNRAQHLIDSMEAHDFPGTNKWWVRRRWLDYYPDDHEFCIDVMSSKDIENQLVAAVQDVFDEFREAMELVNQYERARFQKAKK